jgi:fumarate hydratase, class II
MNAGVSPEAPVSEAREVRDVLGSLVVPPGALWGASTERARRVFTVGTRPMPRALVRALASLKGAAAVVNARLGRLDAARAQAIDAAAQAVLAGEHDAQFPLKLWQSGSATQTHMNVNEVLAALAQARLSERGEPADVHANDHVNLGQSSNDMVPSAMHVCALNAVTTRLLPSLEALMQTLDAQAVAHGDVVKLGRTHLQDAVPMPLCEELCAWRAQLDAGRHALLVALPAVRRLAAGGSAVGSGLNGHPDFARLLCDELSVRLGEFFQPAAHAYAAQAGHEALLQLHGAVRGLAATLFKLANDVRFLACGPRGGIGELVLPVNEPGSSVMPGKVNPTQCEALVMVCCQIFGNDVALTWGAAGGQLQLNACKPLILANVLDSTELLGDSIAAFDVHLMRGVRTDRDRIALHLQRTLMLATALVPHLGYDRAAAIARHAHAQGTDLRAAALADGVSGVDFERWVQPQAMAWPHGGPGV